MGANIITTEDLEIFRTKLLEEIREILMENGRIGIDHWIKSNKVMEKLGISPGTLQNFRVNRTLPFTKLGGILYYDEGKINTILENNEMNIKKEVL